MKIDGSPITFLCDSHEGLIRQYLQQAQADEEGRSQFLNCWTDLGDNKPPRRARETTGHHLFSLSGDLLKARPDEMLGSESPG